MTFNFSWLQLIQLSAVLLTGLIAGLFYGFDCSIIKGLGNLDDKTYLQSFQSINLAIQNLYFFISFMGCLILLPLNCWLSYQKTGFYLILAATILYFIGVFGITVVKNIPLNEKLANFQVQSAAENEIKAMRQSFEKSWNQYHTYRTIAAIVVFGLAILSIWREKQ